MILDDLYKFKAQLIKSGTIIFVIRHAEKKISQNLKKDHLSLLTDKGKKDSKIFGEKVIETLGEIKFVKTSPIQRCIQTAESIISRNFEKIIVSNLLGDPGVFVTDAKLALDNYIDLGVKEVIERQFKRLDLPGLRDLKSGLVLFVQEILTDFKQINGVGIYISHDAIIIPLIKYFTENFVYSENLIDYLNGIILCKKNEDYLLLWNGKAYQINKKIELLFNHVR